MSHGREDARHAVDVFHATLVRAAQRIETRMVYVMSSTPDQQPDLGLAGMRRRYFDKSGVLLKNDLADTWLGQFERWFADAVAGEVPEPNAMILATAAPDGRPSARTVLLKALDSRGFVFFTNYQSRKGTELAENPYASLVFPWYPIFRQVVVVGEVQRVDRADTEAYFAGRPRESQIGAWASPQSEVIDNRQALDAAEQAAELEFADLADIPAPPFWGGLRVCPETVEFWHGRVGRLHDRLRFVRSDEGLWNVQRLAP
jgi:pyridoxamine 5'-phosphate oxidase